MNTIVAPSLLAADFLNLESEIKKLNKTNAKWLHLDVMDGNFVPNLTFGYDLISRIKAISMQYFDVHLMIDNPGNYIDNFIEAGANMITIHYEAVENNEIKSIIKKVHDQGVKIGLAIKPQTPIESLDEFLDIIDMVLVMSVEPGFGGQSFIESSYDKIKYFDEIKKSKNMDYLIQVDGGINNLNFEKVKAVGCNVLVAGSYLFNEEMNNRIDMMLK